MHPLGVKKNRSGPQRLRNLYHAAGGKCYYCQRICNKPATGGVRLPTHELNATVEHLYSRDDIRRLLADGKKIRVLSCYRCNQEANKQFQQQYITPGSTLDHPWLIGILHANKIT